MKESAFTLIEMLVVISVIMLLMAIAYPAYGYLREKAEFDATRQLVAAVAASIGSAGSYHVTFVPSGMTEPVSRYLWDFNDDQQLDGDPALDPAWTAAQRAEAVAADYRGFVIDSRAVLPKKHIDAVGRVVDSWGQVLQIRIEPEVFGASAFGLWSIGPDGIDGSDDDITSWQKQSIP